MIVELLLTALIQDAPATRRSYLAFQHDKVNTTRYQACIDALPCVDIVDGPKSNQAPAGEVWKLFPAVTEGDHTATVLACNNADCSDPSNVTTFRFRVIPGNPNNLRIELR